MVLFGERNQWKRRDEFHCRYLAKTAGSNISISSTYILFLTKMQKRQTPENGFAIFENDITDSESTFKMTDR